jgi:hypothetical protein
MKEVWEMSFDEVTKLNDWAAKHGHKVKVFDEEMTALIRAANENFEREKQHKNTSSAE